MNRRKFSKISPRRAARAENCTARAAALVRDGDDRERVRRALAQMGAVGGDAAWLAEMIAARIAAWPDERRANRDAAIIALACGCAARGDRGRASEIAKKMRRYAASAWLSERHAHAAPKTLGAERHALFAIMKNGGAIGAEAIRKILANARGAGDSVGILSGVHNTHRGAQAVIRSEPGNPMNAAAKPTEFAAVVGALARQPGTIKLLAEDHARVIAERQALVDAIAKLDAQAEIDWPNGQAAIKSAASKVRADERRLRESNEALAGAHAAATAASWTYTIARRAHEEALTAGADVATIEAWRRELLDEMDALRRPGVLIAGQSLERHPVTRKEIRQGYSNAPSIRARMAALREALESCDLLKLEPDQARLPAIIAEIRAAWPQVDQNPGFAETAAA